MAMVISEEAKLHFVFTGLVGDLFEESMMGLKPKSFEVLKDYLTRNYSLILVFSEGFSVHIKVPYHKTGDKDLLYRFSTMQTALEGASVHFSQSMYNNLFLQNGSHLVAAIGGYAHGEALMMNIQKPSLIIAASDMFSHCAAPAEALLAPPSVTTVPYFLSKYRGGDVPAYILHPWGECPTEEFVKETFKEFPILGLLPASQGFIYTDTAFLSQRTSIFPLRSIFR